MAAKQHGLRDVLRESAAAAVGSGVSGALAMGVQVLTMMWLRTTMNTQYRDGGGTLETMQKLWRAGGVARFYAGLGPALMEAPLARFGDTAANTGMMTLLSKFERTKDLSAATKTLAASASVGLFRVALLPIDTLKVSAGVALLACSCRGPTTVGAASGRARAGSAEAAGQVPQLWLGSALARGGRNVAGDCGALFTDLVGDLTACLTGRAPALV